MTTQVHDIIRFEGFDLPIGTEPLAPYIRMADIDLVPTGVACSACWRGYRARFEVIDGRLYLSGVEVLATSDRNQHFDDIFEPLPLTNLFPGFDRLVFAHWFSGSIPIDHERKDLLIRFQEGRVIELRPEGSLGPQLFLFMQNHAEITPVRTDLLAQSTIREVEAQELVYDPRGAVPEKPFGHLNWKWEEFKAAMEESASLWRFSYDRLGGRYSGYASVANERIDGFILTSLSELDG